MAVVSRNLQISILARIGLKSPLLAIQGHFDNLRKVQSLAAGVLFNLRFATESVGHQYGVLGSIAQMAGELVGKDFHRNVVFMPLESKASGHPATTAI